ncbi:hypothetical protein KCP69_05605 [Salmonella enterica subsp. enterica]|nr:hypothetical protein KCP69_05605 [Salmonella enterica subsp. enterica]
MARLRTPLNFCILPALAYGSGLYRIISLEGFIDDVPLEVIPHHSSLSIVALGSRFTRRSVPRFGTLNGLFSLASYRWRDRARDDATPDSGG